MFLKHIPLGFFTLLAWQMAVQTSVGPGQKAEDEATEPTPRLINIIDRSSVLLFDSPDPKSIADTFPFDTTTRTGSQSADRVVVTAGYSENLIISSLACGSSISSLQISQTALERSQVRINPRCDIRMSRREQMKNGRNQGREKDTIDKQR